ncbi:MAG TPA: hypothetical protein PLM98_14690, partial [Thiolinea sp.]|nr:hypothetical protein [Thiolinea sp.]
RVHTCKGFFHCFYGFWFSTNTIEECRGMLSRLIIISALSILLYPLIEPLGLVWGSFVMLFAWVIIGYFLVKLQKIGR